VTLAVAHCNDLTEICGVSKKLAEWYQKTNTTEDKKQINFIGLQNNRHPSQHTVGNIHKASGNCREMPL
jgi:phage anti-repressor protein